MTPTPTLVERILWLTQWQVGLALALAALTAWGVDVALRGRWNASRRQLMGRELTKMRDAALAGLGLWISAEGIRRFGAPPWLFGTLGFVVLVAWLVLALRASRVFVFEWLFASSTREGVPLLLIDLFTLGASLVAFGALLHTVFLLEIASLIATSAVASVVLGLALQDTLGHLFAGISLQLDRPFRLGDWIEVRVAGEKVVGQVLEVSWRATMMLSLTEELMTIPNKSVAQGLVLNFAGRERPFVRSYWFRIALDAPVRAAKEALLEAALATDGILRDPGPIPLIIEITESWIALKMVAFIDDYSRQFVIGDDFQSRALRLLAERGLALATSRLLVNVDASHIAGTRP